ncbi:hypothetical protein C0Q70_14320 [Pomacea canaliculata]|uniref:Uncharacterized protein n=1 Tax=Pomacea canaliculata TaxID=400727 RepID=A0A2T7NZN9_POMCA|nr:hypothetical protein C0Q70_14320 [Pomacea canaliculata]
MESTSCFDKMCNRSCLYYRLLCVHPKHPTLWTLQWSLPGVSTSPTMLAQARRAVKTAGDKCPVVVVVGPPGGVSPLPLKNGGQDSSAPS